MLFLTLLAGLAAAAPTQQDVFRRDTSAAAIIAAIMPSSTSCDGAAYPADCATNVEAAPYFISAMQSYNITSSAQMAGVLALVAYESGELKYRHNVYPGTPGQGTSNMQSLAYNTLYATAHAELAAGLTAAAGDPNSILALVTPDAYNFGSGPWFLATQCSDDVRTQLATGTDAGFTAYMGCVGVDLSESGRLTYWHTALTAFGL